MNFLHRKKKPRAEWLGCSERPTHSIIYSKVFIQNRKHRVPKEESLPTGKKIVCHIIL
jgi:hypothetical protein